ncbi:MAG TPA: alpha/beta hydrolase [Bacteroidia bacterium]|nr:alpha/beta hydrolase [Bacteroidia bacterium]
MDRDTGIVLIHGAGLGGWIWQEMRNHLRFPSLAAEFPGRDRHKIPKSFHLKDYSNELVRQVDSWHKHRLVIVGHSIGGMMAMRVAKFFGPRVIGYVAIGSILPTSGGAYFSALQFPGRIIMPLLLRAAGTKPPDVSIRKGYCSELTRAQCDEVVRRFVAESPHLYTERCEAGIPAAKKCYVITTSDRLVSVKQQQRYAHSLKADTIIRFASGHLPMLSHPKDLADLLNLFSESITQETEAAAVV